LKVGHSFLSLNNVDKVNLLVGLQETIAYSLHQQSEIMNHNYPELEKLQFTVKFQIKRARSVEVRLALKLDLRRWQQRALLLVQEGIDAGQSAEFQLRDDLGNDDYHCWIIEFDGAGMVNAIVIESIDDDYLQDKVYALTRGMI
jgi:hypothetical protein